MQKYFLTIVLLILGLTLSSQSVEFENYKFEASDGRIVDTELGTLLVPENREVEDSRKIKVKFVRFKSISDNPGSPIVYLAGGPGGSGIDAARGSRFDMFMALREIGDVIAFDQRGTGMSDAFLKYNGYWIIDPTTAMDREEAGPIIQEETKKAVAYWKDQGIDVAAYNSNSSADDIDELREALGAEKVNLVGISYGTHLSLTYLKRHEKKVDHIILAGVEGYDHTVKLPLDQQVLMEEIDRLIKEDPIASKAYPDFLGDVKKLLDHLEVAPAEIPTINPLTGQPMIVMAGKMEMQILLSMMLRGPSLFKSMPLEVKQMLNGDFSSMKDWILYTHVGQFRGMSLPMDVASGITEERLILLKEQREKTLLGDAINWPYLEQWKALEGFDLGDEFRSSFYSEKPVLCISGTLDGRTPPGNAVETLKDLPNGKHLTIKGAGHSDPLFLSSPRIVEVMLSFLGGKEVQDETIKLPPVEWSLPDESDDQSAKG